MQFFALILLTFCAFTQNNAAILNLAKGLTSFVFSSGNVWTDWHKKAMDAMFGASSTLAVNLITQFCKSALELDILRPLEKPDINIMYFELRTPCDAESHALLEPQTLLDSALFDPDKKLVIVVLGWMTTINMTEDVDQLVQAFYCRNDSNFLAFDIGNTLRTFYSWSAVNTEKIAIRLALSLQNLSAVIPLERIHLIGHSLGAHIAGQAGRFFRDLTGRSLPHITGLDPARPCFNHERKLRGIKASDAKFVDIIHTNVDVLGQVEAVGSVDFYVGALEPVRHGCLGNICSHMRAISYYIESIFPANENNFLANHCTSRHELHSDACKGPRKSMGYGLSHDAHGVYSVEVNQNEPYGKNAPADFLPVADQTCGICN